MALISCDCDEKQEAEKKDYQGKGMDTEFQKVNFFILHIMLLESS